MEINKLQQLLSEMSLQEKNRTDGTAYRCIF